MKNEFTNTLIQIKQGKGDATQLVPLVYSELYRIAQSKIVREKPGQTLGATALVHEAFIRLVDQPNRQDWETQAHFFAAAAEAMRRILIERARRKKRVKHGGNYRRIELDVNNVQKPTTQNEQLNGHLDILALDIALDEFSKEAPDVAQLVKLRYFGGATMEQIAQFQDISLRTAHRKWIYAKSRLFELVNSQKDALEK